MVLRHPPDVIPPQTLTNLVIDASIDDEPFVRRILRQRFPRQVGNVDVTGEPLFGVRDGARFDVNIKRAAVAASPRGR